MNRDRRGAGIFHPPREIGGVDLVGIPSRAHLDGDGNLHRARHRPDDIGGVRRFAHQAAPGVVLRDLRHRASHVDVDDVGADAFDDLRGRRHLFRIAAEDLNRDRPLFFGVLRVFERAIDPAHQPLGAHHLADDQTAPALPLHETAECRVRHARHRRERKRRRQFDGSDLHKG